METFVLHALISCVSEENFSEYILTHIVCMENFDLHELIETSVLHEMILCVSEGLLSSLF